MGKLEELYRRHVQSVFRYALRCTGRRDLAEDLTSDAFLALNRNLDRIDESLLPGWLFTVVRNRARDLWRRRAAEQRYAEQLANRPPAQAPQFDTWILQCAGLKPVHRTCLALRYVYGLNRAEISARTGLSEMQVKSCLQYGLELLRKAYATSAKEVQGDAAAR
jgi:RNA polymerase sigma-70 factor (ECF subfamily)